MTTHHTPRRARRALQLLLVLVTLGTALVGPAAEPADAASLYRPTIRCESFGVRVIPGIGALGGQSDGYWRAHLWKWDGRTWQYVDTRQGRESASTATVGGNTFHQMQQQAGYYAVSVQRWNATSNGWLYRGHTWARTDITLGIHAAGSYYCKY